MGQLKTVGNRYHWIGTYDERHIPKAAGFRWDPTARVWWTDDPKAAESVDSRPTEEREAVERRKRLASMAQQPKGHERIQGLPDEVRAAIEKLSIFKPEVIP